MAMNLLDLTDLMPAGSDQVLTKDVLIKGDGVEYTGVIYETSYHSTAGTYLDLPGHIKETADGMDAACYPLERLFRVKATVVHLDRAGGTGEIPARELIAAAPSGGGGGALVINALGTRRHDAIEDRSVWLGKDAVQWIISTGIHLLVADVYENKPVSIGVFPDLFRNRISTVCCSLNLHLLVRPWVRLTVLPLRFPEITQLPCRILAEMED
jgi:kynurenine formamidase